MNYQNYQIYKEYNLTEEQHTYVTFSEITDTKLSACAGSGKTQVIVLRNIYLLENNLNNFKNNFDIFRGNDIYCALLIIYDYYNITNINKNIIALIITI